MNKTFKFDINQYGFQKNSSCVGAVVDMVDFITEEIDKNKYVIVVFIDLRKAFDTVDIGILLDKLQKMGFRGVCYDLLKSYSENRVSYVCMDDCESERLVMTTGVAQGSVLGPIEYLLYVHSLKFLKMGSRYYKFADDTAFVLSADNMGELENVMNQDLELYYDWLCYNRLTLNIDKTVYMIIKQKNKKRCDIEIKINDTALKKVEEYRYLGLLIDDKLSWRFHIEKLKNKLAPMIGAVRRCANFLNDRARRVIYESFIASQLRYMIVCWGNAPKYLMEQIQRYQNRAVKAVYALDYFTSTDSLYTNTSIFNIEKMRAYEQVKLIYNIKKNYLKTQTKLQLVNECHAYPIRTQNQLRTNYRRTVKSQNTPIYRSIMTYNSVPVTVTDSNNPKKMCRNLREYLELN